MIAGHRYVIAVPDLRRSSEFYRDVLGFAIRPIGDPGWLFYEQGECTIMAGECTDAIPPADLGDHSYFAYLLLDDIDACYERARSHGAEIVKPLRSEPWGMHEFGLRTVDGHRVMLAQRLMPSSRLSLCRVDAVRRTG